MKWNNCNVKPEKESYFDGVNMDDDKLLKLHWDGENWFVLYIGSEVKIPKNEVRNYQYLDESIESPTGYTGADVPGEEGVDPKKLEDLTDEHAIEIFHLTGGGSALSHEAIVFQVKQILTTNKFYTEQTNLPGKSWWKIFKFLLNQGYYWDGSDLAGALSVRQQGDAVAVLDWLLKQSDLGILIMNDGCFYYEEDKDGDQPLESEDIVKLYLNENPQSPASLPLGIVDKLRESNPYKKLTTSNIHAVWNECCDTLASLYDNELDRMGKLCMEKDGEIEQRDNEIARLRKLLDGEGEKGKEDKNG
jgi:hypothetical protein